MAISQMTKIMIASHRSEAQELLEAIQAEGIVQVLDAERAMVSKEWPELQIEPKRPRDIEDMVARLDRAIKFLEMHATEKGPATLFNPLVEIDRQRYSEVVTGQAALDLLSESEKVQADIDRLGTEYENNQGILESLLPWAAMVTSVDELRELRTTTCLSGLMPHSHYDEICQRLREMGAAVEQVGTSGNTHACLVVCLNEIVGDVQKLLRSADFELVSFEGMAGKIGSVIERCEDDLADIGVQLGDANNKAAELARDRLTLQILFDHYQNLLQREQTHANAPATEHTVLLEGWVRKNDYASLKEVVGGFGASSVGEIEAGEGEVPPVEIDNHGVVRSFEVVTRLYGMPAPVDVDPTVFLAPFFALFFGICLTDAAYGLVMVAFFAWLVKPTKGDTRFFWMMITCSITTVVAGALTGGWCGDAIQQFIPALNGFRQGLMWFDPMEKPMYFFTISLVLGYLQIIFAISVAFVHKIKRKDYESAIFDHGTWLVWLNSLAVFGLAKAGVLPAFLGPIFGVIAAVPAVGILLFSEREGGWGARIGMGFYNVFSTVFYVGDVLSYIRLMALGMVTGGFGMAINQIAVQVKDVQYVGWLLALLVFAGGHLFNIANSALGSFVHSMRLQFVEFFTKFIVGGGKQFEPLEKKYRHIKVEE